MTDSEFYHRDIFGNVIDIDLQEEDDFSAPIKTASGKEFNVFAFTDAIGERKKRDAWIIYQKALLAGVSAEELFFKAVWVVKAMLLANKCGSAEEAGLNPFVYRKSKSFASKFSPQELEKLSEDLVIGYHEARRGNKEIETTLEKILLNL